MDACRHLHVSAVWVQDKRLNTGIFSWVWSEVKGVTDQVDHRDKERGSLAGVGSQVTQLTASSQLFLWLLTFLQYPCRHHGHRGAHVYPWCFSGVALMLTLPMALCFRSPDYLHLLIPKYCLIATFRYWILWVLPATMVGQAQEPNAMRYELNNQHNFISIQ